MAEETRDAGEPSKQELQRQMEETRESISATVSEIREVVSGQYEAAVDKIETVRESVTDVLDWREKFKEDPMVWGAGALSVGILIGLGLARVFDDEGGSARGRRRKSEAAELAATLVRRLSHVGDAVLPAVSRQVKEMFGIDLNEYFGNAPTESRAAAKSVKAGAKKRGAGAAQGGARKRAAGQARKR